MSVIKDPVGQRRAFISKQSYRPAIVEPLEKRQLLSTVGLPAETPDLISLGQFGSKTKVTKKNNVSAADPSDVFKVHVKRAVALTVKLDKLSANADLVLQNLNGETVKASSKLKKSAEKVSAKLGVGDWYVVVNNVDAAKKAKYRLTVESKKTKSTVIPAPAPAGPDGETPPPEQTGPFLEFGPDVILVGEETRLDVRARLAAAAGAVAIPLNEVTSTGAIVGKLADLFDDGQAIHRDAVAGDGIFSNSTVVTFREVETRYYVAGETGQQSPTATVRSREPVAQQELTRNISQNQELTNLAATQLNSGATEAQTLDVIVAALNVRPDVIDPASISKGSRSVAYKSREGVLSTVSLDQAQTTSQRNGGGDNAQGAAAPQAMAADNATDDCGDAIILAPYAYQFEPYDEGDNLTTTLTNAGYDVTLKRNGAAADQNVLVEDFKNLGQYDTVIVSAHGDSSFLHGVIILTGQTFVGADALAPYAADLISGRLSLSGNLDSGTLAITPSFVSYYGGSFDDSVVYVGACRSAWDSSMANAFTGAGAAAYIGYTDYVGSDFAYNRALSMYNTLLAETDNTVANIPGINVDVETDSDPALFKMWTSDATAVLPMSCDLLRNFDLYIEYSWPQAQKDLDTATSFLEVSEGFASNQSSDYIEWSGDDTTYGGVEKVTIKLYEAWLADDFDDETFVGLRNGWYAPANGSGPALVAVAIKHRTTGETKHLVQRSTTPGSQSSLAQYPVGEVQIHLSAGEDPVVSFDLV